MPSVDPRTFVLLGMCAYLTGVTQAPLTSAVISLELTDTNQMLLPILATVLIARAVSGLVCKTPIYRGLAEQLLAVPAPAAERASTSQRQTSAGNSGQDDAPHEHELPHRSPAVQHGRPLLIVLLPEVAYARNALRAF